MGVVAVAASRAAVTTHVYWDWVPSSFEVIVGSALETIVELSRPTNSASSRPLSASSVSRLVIGAPGAGRVGAAARWVAAPGAGRVGAAARWVVLMQSSFAEVRSGGSTCRPAGVQGNRRGAAAVRGSVRPDGGGWRRAAEGTGDGYAA